MAASTQKTTPPAEGEEHDRGFFSDVWNDIKGAAPAIGAGIGAVAGGVAGVAGAAYGAVGGALAGGAVKGSSPVLDSSAPPPPIAPAAPPTPATSPKVTTAEEDEDIETSKGQAANILAGGLYNAPPQLARNILLGS